MNAALLYDEQFAKVFPFDWEMKVLAKHIASVKSFLDVGCGTGRHIIPLAERGLQVLGVDNNKQFVEAAIKKLKSKGLVAKVDLVVADARFLPFKRALFDGAICMGNVLGDVDVHKAERIAILREMIRTAKSKSHIYNWTCASILAANRPSYLALPLLSNQHAEIAWKILRIRRLHRSYPT